MWKLLTGSGHGPVAGSEEHEKLRPGSVKGGEFIDQLSDCQLLKKHSAPWNWCLSRPLIPFVVSVAIMRGEGVGIRRSLPYRVKTVVHLWKGTVLLLQ